MTGLPLTQAPTPLGGVQQRRSSASRGLRSVWRVVLRNRTGQLGVAILTLVVLLAILGPALSQQDPLQVSGLRLAGPSPSHWLGTDGVGRDVFSRLANGARLSLGSTALVAAIVLVVATAIGTLAGYFRGPLDAVLMRFADVVLAFPGLILALALAGLFTPGLPAVLVALVSVSWASYARIVRGLTLSIRERPFIEAARASGAPHRAIMLRHIVPNVVSPVIVLITLEMGQLLLAISALSFLGLGVQPPTPEWGAMLNDGRAYVLSDPLVILIPGAAISLAVLGFNLLGDALRDALDPRMR